MCTIYITATTMHITGYLMPLLFLLKISDKWLWIRERPLIHIWYNAVTLWLKIREEWKPDTAPMFVSCHQWPVVCQCVVVEEESTCDVECNKHIYRVMFMRGENEENSKQIGDPCESVNEIHSMWSIWNWIK